MLSRGGKRVLGAAAIVAGIVVVVLGVTQPNPFAHRWTYWAEFNSVQGLGAVGRDIRMAGVNVGTIGEVRRDGDDAVVELILDRDIRLHTDARADMRPHTLFEGSSFVDLAPGSPSAPLLEHGGTIPLERTSNYVTLDEAFRILRPEIRDRLRELAATGSKTLRGAAVVGIQRTLRNSPELTRRLKGPARALQGRHRRELSGAISGMAETVDAVAGREQELIPLARRLNRTAAALEVDRAAPLDATLAALPGALRQLNDGAPELTHLVDRVDSLAGQVNPALGDLTRALHEGTPLLERAIPILRRTTPMVRDLGRVASRLAASAPTLAHLIRSLDPVTKVFGDSVLPVLLADSRTGPPTYEQLLATFTAADAVFRPYQRPSQNPNGSGHLWNLGTYGSPGTSGSPFGGAAVSCRQVGEVSAAAERDLRAGGECR